MARETELKISAKTAGTDEAARKLGDVAAAQDRIAGGARDGAKASEAQTQATEKLNASEGDYIQLLTQINPLLGRFVGAAIKGSKVAGDLASQNISLAGAAKKASAAIKANAGSLKLMIAGGAVVAGILLIASALRKMKEEAEAAAKAIRDQTDALNELEGKRRDTQANIERISDRRRGGGFNADESRAATTQAKRIRDKFDQGALSDAAIEQVVGSAFGRGGFTEDDLIDLAFQQDRGNLNVNPEDRIEIIRSRLDAANRNDPESLTKFRKRERTQRTESIQEAGKQLATEGGVTIDLERVVRQGIGPGTTDEEVKRIVEAVQIAGGTREGARQNLDRLINETGLSEADFLNLQNALNAVEQLIRRGQRLGTTNITINQNVTNNNQNQRQIGTDHAARERRVVGGGNLADVRRNEIR